MEYFATYGGYEVDVRSKASWYKIKVKEGVRGFNIPVHAVYNRDLSTWQISFHGKLLTIESVEQIV